MPHSIADTMVDATIGPRARRGGASSRTARAYRSAKPRDAVTMTSATSQPITLDVVATCAIAAATIAARARFTASEIRPCLMR